VKPPDKTTEELIMEIKQELNVEENFHQLFERSYEKVRRYFQRKRFSPEDSLELTQETFIAVYKGLKGFRHEAPFENWLFSIAKNVLRSELERKNAEKRHAPIVSLNQQAASKTDEFSPSVERIVDPKPDQLTHVLNKESSQKLHEALEQLPERGRRCMELRLADLRYEEIAKLMAIEIGTVKAHLHQAKEHLNNKLRPYVGEIDV
jgi:RNA polymerase sigma-70 factor, ECF subfamily